MIARSALKDFLHNDVLSRLDGLLLILATENCRPRMVAEIKDLALSAGLRKAKSWNVSQIMATSGGLAIRGTEGWELTQEGKRRVRAITGAHSSAPSTQATVDLRGRLAAVKDSNTLEFLNEAVTCLEDGLNRAGVVLSWVGAISMLYDHVVKTELPAFNAEAARRDTKWKAAKSSDDLSRMKEHDFLNVLESISVIGKNVKQELQSCLTLRNSCGHPNSLKIGPIRVASHIEILVLNVFQRF